MGQDPVTPQEVNPGSNKNLIWEDEGIFRKQMKANGLSEAVINKLVEDRIALAKTGRQIKWNSLMKLGNSVTPVPHAACSDMGGESGWGAWQAQTGDYMYDIFGGNSTLTWGAIGAPLAAPRFNLTSGAGIDACTPGAAAGAPSIPVVAPNFGSASIQLGEIQTNGSLGGCNLGCAEQIIYPLTVTAMDTNFLYAYAFVLENPGHTIQDQPYVEFKILDASGDTLPCSYQKYHGSSNLPGFYTSSCNVNSASIYKPWTTVGVNLSSYIGQALTVVITNVDCSQGGHFAQSYWDFSCGVLTTNPSSYCQGNAVTIDAPVDPLIGYTYQWYQNGGPYTGAPGATGPTITPFPVPGDTFAVDVIQPSGCNFHIIYVPTPMSITPNFTSTVNCGVVNFTDQTTTPNGSPITAWNWTFPSGTPASSTAQNPTGVTFPPGTYSVTLVATSQSGCVGTSIHVITVTGMPQAVFSNVPVCAGLSTQFTNSSVAPAGDPIVSTNWSFPGGNPATSTASNPTVVFPAGNYTATLTVTTQSGCTSTVSQPVVVNPLPVANLSGNNVCFNNVNSFTDLTTGNNTVTNWSWNFGDGSALNTTQNPTHTYSNPGTYTVSLIVTNNFGCKDTNKTTVVINPLPVVNFSLVPVCYHDNTCFTDLSTVSPGTISSWSWNFGDPNSGANNISNIQNPCHVYTGLGPYAVILTVTTDSACQSTISLPATVNPLPVAGISVNSVCLNSNTSFTDASISPAGDQITAWNWNFGDGSANATQQNPMHMYTTAGSYTATLIVTTQKGCKDTAQIPLVVYNPPVANFSAPKDGCSPVVNNYMDLSTSASGSVSSWLWTFSGGSPSSSTSQNPQNILYVAPGSYSVTLIATTNFGCKDTITLPMVQVYPWPGAEFCVAPQQAPATSPVFNFCDLWSSDVTQWSWNFGDGSALDSSNTDPVHSYSATATANDFYSYTICLNVKNQYGCWDSICHTVELLPEYEFYIPNCFTPNQDYTNEFFFGKCRGVKEYNIWVFDRWGNLLWDCHKEDKNTNWDNLGQDGLSSACKWNGKVVQGGFDMSGGSGQLAQEDVYVWKVRLTDIFDKKHMYIGHVSIVK